MNAVCSSAPVSHGDHAAPIGGICYQTYLTPGYEPGRSGNHETHETHEILLECSVAADSTAIRSKHAPGKQRAQVHRQIVDRAIARRREVLRPGAFVRIKKSGDIAVVHTRL